MRWLVERPVYLRGRFFNPGEVVEAEEAELGVLPSLNAVKPLQEVLGGNGGDGDEYPGGPVQAV